MLVPALMLMMALELINRHWQDSGMQPWRSGPSANADRPTVPRRSFSQEVFCAVLYVDLKTLFTIHSTCCPALTCAMPLEPTNHTVLTIKHMWVRQHHDALLSVGPVYTIWPCRCPALMYKPPLAYSTRKMRAAAHAIRTQLFPPTLKPAFGPGAAPH